jgi:16S rRNA (cytosine967-C5)-methyltransferase
MRGEGVIHACDISKEKISLIRENLIRMGIHNVKLKKQDARVLREEWVGKADVVLADLPCSGLGVIGHKADIKYKTKPGDIRALAVQQRKILQTAHQYVKPGGFLLYSTCTIAPEENEEQVTWILENLPFHPVSIENNLPPQLQNATGEKGYLQILPTPQGGDGFFIAVFQRNEEQHV